MNEFQQKRRLQRTLYSKTSIVIFAIVSMLILRGSWNVLQKERQSRRNMEEVEKNLIIARQREAELASNIERLNSPQGVESEIRGKYSVKKDGEEVVLVVENSKSTTTPEHIKSFWNKISDWFSSLFK